MEISQELQVPAATVLFWTLPTYLTINEIKKNNTVEETRMYAEGEMGDSSHLI